MLKAVSGELPRKGMRAVVIERKYIGGSCPNIACLPSKNVIHSAKVASYFWRSAEFGISKDNTRISMAGVRDRKRKMVDPQSVLEQVIQRPRPDQQERRPVLLGGWCKAPYYVFAA